MIDVWMETCPHDEVPSGNCSDKGGESKGRPPLATLVGLPNLSPRLGSVIVSAVIFLPQRVTVVRAEGKHVNEAVRLLGAGLRL